MDNKNIKKPIGPVPKNPQIDLPGKPGKLPRIPNRPGPCPINPTDPKPELPENPDLTPPTDNVKKVERPIKRKPRVAKVKDGK